MSDLAYDITYLLEAEAAQPPVPPRPVARAVPAVAPPLANAVSAQEALARELLQAADAHEEMIRQYLCSSGAVFPGATRQ